MYRRVWRHRGRLWATFRSSQPKFLLTFHSPIREKSGDRRVPRLTHNRPKATNTTSNGALARTVPRFCESENVTVAHSTADRAAGTLDPTRHSTNTYSYLMLIETEKSVIVEYIRIQSLPGSWNLL